MKKYSWLNTHYLFLIMSLTLFPFLLQGQSSCHSGGVIFSSQQDVDDFPINFPDCTEIDGFLQIGDWGTDLNDLSPLAQLTTVNGALIIKGNSMINDLIGLQNLTSVDGKLEVIGNSSLVNFVGLEGINSLNGEIWMINNGIVNLDGLENITSINGYIDLNDNDNLVDINGLENIDPATVNSINFNGDYLSITNHAILSECAIEVVCSIIEDPTKDYSIMFNNGNCLSAAQVINICSLPSCTTITNPIDEATNIERDVTVEWTSEPDADYYSFSVRQGLYGPFIVDGENVGLATSYDLEDLAYDSTYYVRAKPFNSFGGGSNCDYSSFTIKSLQPHPSATFTYPQDGQLLLDVNLTITWDEIADIDNYELIIDGGSYNDFHWTTTNNFFDASNIEWNENYSIQLIAYTIPGEDFSYPPISFSTVDGESHSIVVADDNEEHQFTQFRLMDPDTYEIIMEFNSQVNPTVVELPNLPLLIYYRTQQLYDSHNEVFIDLSIEDIPDTLFLPENVDPGYFEEFKFSNQFLFIDDEGEYHATVKMDPAHSADSIFWYPTTDLLNGQVNMKGKVRFLDDGLGNDLIAGDKLFTSESIPNMGSFGFLNGQARNETIIALSFFEGFQIWQNGVPNEFKFNQYPGAGLVVKDSITANPMESAASNLYHNDYIVNIVRPDANISDVIGDAQILYNTFQDTFDQIFYHYPERSPLGGNSPYHVRVKNEVAGIGLDIFDNSSAFGSQGKLEGYNVISSVLAWAPYNHELNHQWSAHLVELFNTIGGHWGYSSVGGVLGGEHEDNYEYIGNNQISVYSGQFSLNGLPNGEGKVFSDLELYLMGVMDTIELREEYTVFNGMMNLGNGIYQYADTTIHSKEAIINFYGNRDPAPITTGIDMRTAMLVVTEEPLSLAGASFYTYLAKAWEGTLTEEISPYDNYFSFDKATDYRVNMITRLPDICIDDLFEYSNPTDDGNYHAANNLISIGLIPTNGNVFYKANAIELKEGFEVKADAFFEALINPCSN